jgi:hypothetical protein
VTIRLCPDYCACRRCEHDLKACEYCYNCRALAKLAREQSEADWLAQRHEMRVRGVNR